MFRHAAQLAAHGGMSMANSNETLKNAGEIKKTGRGGARVGAGRKKAIHNEIKLAIREEAQKHGPKAIAQLVQIMTDREQPAASRVSAAGMLLDRGYGKPINEHEHNHKGDVSVTAKVVLVPSKATAEVTTKRATKDEE
jgi:hypothetical protein